MYIKKQINGWDQSLSESSKSYKISLHASSLNAVLGEMFYEPLKLHIILFKLNNTCNKLQY